MTRPRLSAALFIRLGAATALVALAAAQAPATTIRAASSTTDDIVVNTGTVARTLAPTFFGINYVGFWDSAQGSTASSNALAQTPIKSVRFAGGDPADWYDWQDPYYQGWSSTSPLDLWHYAQRFGGSAVFQTNYQGHLPDPPGQTYAVNSPQNAAAWTTYDQAQGIQATMEVGNEEDISMTTADDPAFQPYVDAFNAQAAAMHAASPGVKVIGPAGTNEWYWWGLDSLGMFLRQTGNRTGSGQVDGVSLHYYTGTGWSDTYNAAQQWTGSDSPWAYIQSTISANDTRALPVYLTEWNLGDSDNGTGFNQTVGHALVTADMIGAFAQAGVAQEDYYAIHGANSYGLLYGTGESNPVDSPTPTYYAMALWGKMGKYILPLTQSDDPGSTVSAYAGKKDDGSVQVLAINKTGQAQPLQVSYQGFNPQGATLNAYDLTSATGNQTDQTASYDGQSMPSPQQPLPGPHSTQTVSGSSISYSLPAYSMVVLDVVPGSSGNPTPTATATSGGSSSPTPSATNTPQPPSPTATNTPSPTNTPLPPPTNTAVPPTATSTSLSFTIGKVAQSAPAVRPGATVSFTATITSSGVASGELVDFEAYNSAGAKIWQAWRSPLAFAAGKPKRVSESFQTPATLPTGTYTLKLGVFTSAWVMQTWDNSAATFTVSSTALRPHVAALSIARHVRHGRRHVLKRRRPTHASAGRDRRARIGSKRSRRHVP